MRAKATFGWDTFARASCEDQVAMIAYVEAEAEITGGKHGNSQ